MQSPVYTDMVGLLDFIALMRWRSFGAMTAVIAGLLPSSVQVVLT